MTPKIQRKHYIVGALMIAIAFVAQPFSLLFVQMKLAPKIAPYIVKQDSGSDGSADMAGKEIDTTDLKVRGDANAPIYLVEFSDYQCPFCARFHDTPKEIVANSNGKVAWAWKYFPLTQIHPEAHPAAISGECVYKLGGVDKFWTYSDFLIANQANLGDKLYKSEAAKLGLNPVQFQACLNDPATAKVVDDQSSQGEALGVNGTPSTFVVKNENGKLTVLENINGALPKETVESIIAKYSK